MSSLFNQASLVLVPSGYKAGKVYSEVPTDGDGDLTFTRASDATRVNSDGLIEIPRTNLLLYSEEFDNAYWSKQNNSIISANVVVAPDGTITADKQIAANGVIAGIGNANSGLRRLITVTSGVTYTFTIFAKAAEKSTLTTYLSDGSATVAAVYDLIAGTVSDPELGIRSITSVGNGWYRCSLTLTATQSNTRGDLLRFAGSDYTGDGTSGIYIWGAQLEINSTATDYIPTTNSARTTFAGITQDGTSAPNVPRLDYSQGSCPALLLEPQRTNLALYSEQFDNAAWLKSAVSVTANTTTAPDGNTTADKIISNTSSTNHTIVRVESFSSNTYTLSVYAKKAEYDFLALYLFQSTKVTGVLFDIDNGTFVSHLDTSNQVTSYLIEALPNNWYRLSITSTLQIVQFGYTLSNTSTPSYTSTRLPTFLGDGTSGVYLWGAQFEQGAYATSYIPTTSASVTRLADSFSLGSLQTNGIIGSTGLSFFINFRKKNLSGLAARPSLVSAGDLDVIGISTNATSLIASVRIGGGGFANTTILSPYNNEMVKVCFTLNGTTLKVFVNGSLALTTTASSSSVFTQLLTNTSLDKDQEYKKILVFPTPLTDTQAIELTTL